MRLVKGLGRDIAGLEKRSMAETRKLEENMVGIEEMEGAGGGGRGGSLEMVEKGLLYKPLFKACVIMRWGRNP